MSIFELEGKIIKGKGLGKKLEFPTINLAYSGNESGVFKGEVFIDGKKFRAAIHLGTKPTFNDDEKTLEAFLLNFNDDFFSDELLGKKVKVIVLKKTRETKKFASLEELKKQIQKDVEQMLADW